MTNSSIRSLAFLAAASLCLAGPLAAQNNVTLPPDGDNQKSTVTQSIGLVQVTVDYNSPDVHGPTGEDRTGKIWGQLVPYGMANLGFGTCGDQCPWRGGANENTVFTTSHDIQVQGKPLPAGSYGLHFIPGQEEWTVIFSKNHTSWGSFFYDAKEDALRVQTKPEKSEYHEWLTYEFTDRHPDKATVALKWEKLQVPFTVTADVTNLYVENLRRELRSSAGFTWQGWNAAAQYALQNNVNLPEALTWADKAINAPFAGQENIVTLSTLSQLQAANGKADEAAKTMDRALHHPSASPLQIHQYARQLQGQGKNEEALKVFELNAKLHPGAWPVELGLARGYSAVGRKKEAVEHAKTAVKTATTDANRQNAEMVLKQVEEAK